MREIVIYELLSLDGVAESPDRFFDWDDALDANLAAVTGRQDAVLLGRRSYGEWATYWPGSDIEPFATFINGVAKHVVTSTPLEPVWEGATAVDGDLVPFVRHLKEQPGADIGVHASISVARALLAAGVVDRLQLVVSPVVAGSGRRLLDGVPMTRLELVAGTAVASGHLVLDYRVLDAATDPDLAGTDADRVRERLARAGVLASAPPARARPDAELLARARAAAGGGTPLADLVADDRR